MPGHRFVEVDLKKATPTGAEVSFIGTDAAQAAGSALLFARLSSREAELGPLGCVVYPKGPDGPTAWVLRPPVEVPRLFS